VSVIIPYSFMREMEKELSSDDKVFSGIETTPLLRDWANGDKATLFTGQSMKNESPGRTVQATAVLQVRYGPRLRGGPLKGLFAEKRGTDRSGHRQHPCVIGTPCGWGQSSLSPFFVRGARGLV
jgi:hypothetical protein